MKLTFKFSAVFYHLPPMFTGFDNHPLKKQGEEIKIKSGIEIDRQLMDRLFSWHVKPG